MLGAIRSLLPREHLVYLGDTARLPYGTKSGQTITRYALQCAAELVRRDVKMLVVACNTASAVALGALRAAYPDLPVLGVVEPGAKAACEVTRTGHVAVIATESTIAGKAYHRAIHAINPDIRVSGLPCQLFVALAEEGWLEGPVADEVAREYLSRMFVPGSAGETPPDTLVLGCTHFPLLREPIAKAVTESTTIVDSAATAAREVVCSLEKRGLVCSDDAPGGVTYLTTDDVDRFVRTGARFLGTPINDASVELVDL